MKKRAIFIAINSYHLISSAYYAIELKSKFNIETVLVWQRYYSYDIDLEYFKNAFDKVVVNPEIIRGKESAAKRFFKRIITGGIGFGFSEAGKYIKNHLNDNLVVCFTDQDPMTYRMLAVLHSHSNNDVYLVDEGAAVYVTKPIFDYSYSDYRFYLMKLYSILGVKHGAYIGYSNFYDSWIVKKPELLPDSKRINHRVIKQTCFFSQESWKESLSRLNEAITNRIKIDRVKRKLLWISGPLTDCGIEPEVELSILKKLSKMLSRQYTILIKLHPRENYEKYDSIVDGKNISLIELQEFNWVPVEYISSFLNIEGVITIMSSAARNLYENGLDCPFFYFAHLLKDKESDYEAVLKDAQFSNAFIVSECGEIMDILNNWDKKHTQMVLKEDDVNYMLESIQGGI